MKPPQHLPPRQHPKDIIQELMAACAYEEAGHMPGAAYKAAYYLFRDVVDRIGVDSARQIFSHFAGGPTPEQLKRWAHKSLLDRYDMMRKPKIQQFARMIAKENESLPKTQQHGPWGTDWTNIDKLIRRLLKARRDRLDKVKSKMSRTKPAKR